MPLDYVSFINSNVTWDNDKKLRMLNGFVYQYSYQDEIEDEEGDLIPNPVSKVDFANQQIERFIRENIKAWEANQDAEAARLATIAEVDSEFGEFA